MAAAAGQVGALILAAGYSRRFGSDKRLHTLEDARFPGRPLLLATLDVYTAVFPHVAVIVRSDDQAVRSMLCGNYDGITVLTTDRAHLGMGQSLADGAGQVPGWRGLFVGLADMPYVAASTLNKLRSALDGERRIVQPSFRGRPGHPVGFGHAFMAELSRLTGDTGARTVIARHTDARTLVEVDDPGVIVDLDRPPS